MSDVSDVTSDRSTTSTAKRTRISRRTIGKAMIAVGAVGLLVSAAAIVIGRSLVGEVEDSVDARLVVTDEALAAVKDSIALTGTIVDTIRAGITSVGETIAIVDVSLQRATTAMSDTQVFLGGSLPDSLDAVGDVLPTIESVASSVDDALRALSTAPFGPDYDPAQPFDEAIGELSTAIAPLPEQLRTLADDFTDVTSSTSGMSAQLQTLSDDVAALGTQLQSVAGLVDRYAETASVASDLATQSRSDLHSSADATRLLILLLGIVFALGQIVPIWLGIELVRRGTAHTIITRTTDA